MKRQHTQRIIVPGGQDRVAFQLTSREKFERLGPGARIALGRTSYVLRRDCFWDDRAGTISVMPGTAEFN